VAAAAAAVSCCCCDILKPAAGSLFISYTIKSFGALVFAIIMTTRQFLSILLSSLFFGSPLTLGQW
jgi:adenosine 3'-phospho 5'-phosphosulfate transporter B2